MILTKTQIKAITSSGGTIDEVAQAQEIAESMRKLNILYLGDSRVVGVYTTAVWNEIYNRWDATVHNAEPFSTRVYVDAFLQVGQWWIPTNCGRSGSTPWDGVQTLMGDLNNNEMGLYDAAVIWYGINAAKASDPMNPIVWQTLLDQMINTLLYGKDGGYAKYVFLPLSPPVQETEADWLDDHLDSYIAQYNAAIYASSRQDIHHERVFVVPGVVDVWDTSANICMDNIHPGLSGQRAIGDVIFQAIRGILG